jgi:hypothetical protein
MPVIPTQPADLDDWADFTPAAALTLDPTLMQSFEPLAKDSLIVRTTVDINRLQAKRKKNGKLTLRQTRDQRAAAVANKMLAEGEDILKKLRSLAVGDYFCVPVSQITNVRNAAYRDTKERGIKYTTAKFVYGKHWYVKVHRPATPLDTTSTTLST